MKRFAGNVERLAVLLFALVCAGLWARSARAQGEFAKYAGIPAVAGHEQALIKELQGDLKTLSPKTDNMGNVYVTFGSGAPHRLVVTPMDEPGYVVSAITGDGFLRLQRLPQAAPNGVFDLLHAAQPVWVISRSGKRVPGVVAGLSVHLQPNRQNAPKMAHPDEMYVDIGAANAAEARAAGVDVLDPVALNGKLWALGSGEMWAGPRAGDRFGCAVLAELARQASKRESKGTLTIGFVTQQWLGGRGLERLLVELHPDEMIYVGRLTAARGTTDGKGAAPAAPSPGSGILLGVSDPAALAGFAAEIKAEADRKHIALTPFAATGVRIAGNTRGNVLPERVVQLGLATQWPVTPAETVSTKDIAALVELLGDPPNDAPSGMSPASAEQAAPKGTAKTAAASGPPVIQSLIESYGASGHEEQVRETVKKLLPKWAKTETDPAGNLVLHFGGAKTGTKTPKLVFMAHMDEIGYQVRAIESDGRVLVDVLGGGYTEYFLGHVVLVHLSGGQRIAGVLELPNNWDQAGFEWPRGPRTMDAAVHVSVGTKSAEQTLNLGIKTGDWVTIPKEYRPLAGKRANGRAFDDRVGCAALIQAARALGPTLPGRDVTFVWSTEEEVGLRGAAAYAARTAKEGRGADYVFAIDTFVSSDSPIESKRFADAEIGKGFVVRAVDNSNIVPVADADRVVKLARLNKIPVQYGVTGGGNDGSVFPRYGSVDVALGWPLRYSHSPGEVIDTRDLDALSAIVTALAKSW
ncbi:MAG TPA: M20/M25/M40 family metallo-hydrolase [Methylomirabilota bacterium]|nr:M20/M25/M40 family metallo-hydrolase [Methylomirabilota bacterium]